MPLICTSTSTTQIRPTIYHFLLDALQKEDRDTDPISTSKHAIEDCPLSGEADVSSVVFLESRGRQRCQWKDDYRVVVQAQPKDPRYLQIKFRPTPSQTWRSTTREPFPYCALQQSQITYLQSLWSSVSPRGKDMFLKHHCLETAAIHGLFKFAPSGAKKLIESDFSIETSLVHNELTGKGSIVFPSDILPILRDTFRALIQLFSLVKINHIFRITSDEIKDLHRVLMKRSHILFKREEEGSEKLSYCNIGLTRQTTVVDAFAVNELRKFEITIKFCPWDEVDEEMELFVKRFRVLLKNISSTDPFAAAAWIQHVFLTIHPFEGGNGRLSRMLASVPLLMHGLPPLCIPSSDKESYMIALNFIRANRDGDYRPLMEYLYNATVTSLKSFLSEL